MRHEATEAEARFESGDTVIDIEEQVEEETREEEPAAEAAQQEAESPEEEEATTFEWIRYHSNIM